MWYSTGFARFRLETFLCFSFFFFFLVPLAFYWEDLAK